MICNTCGRDNPAHLTFCQECGQKLAPRLATPTPPQGVPPLLEPVPQTKVAATQQRPLAPEIHFTRRNDPASEERERLSCPLCGSRNQRGLRFCVTCGHLLAQGEALNTTLESNAPPARAPSMRPVAAPATSSVPPTAPAQMAPALFATAPTPLATAVTPLATAATAIATPAAPAVVPIAPSRVVQLGDPAPSAPEPRLCPRCRGTSEGQFCRFCGASLADAAAVRGTAAVPALAPPPPAPAPTPPPPAPAPPPRQVHALWEDSIRPASASQHPPAMPSPPPPPPAPPTTPPPPPSVPPTAAAAVEDVLRSTAALLSPGATRPRLVLIARDGGEGPSYGVSDTTDIGRSEGNVVIGDDRYVSPRHARLSLRGGSYHLRDLGSTNGVYLRIPFPAAAAAQQWGGGGDVEPWERRAAEGGARERLPRESEPPGRERMSDPNSEQPLGDQELFLVGQQVLRFEVVKHAEEGFGVASDGGTLLFGTPAAPRYARLSQRTVEGVARDVFHVRKAETVIGRESGDVVFTDDPFLSRRHAVLRVHAGNASAGAKGPRRFTLADLGSSNGTFLQIREEVRLRHGDHFRIGQQLFRFDFDPARNGG